MVEIMKEEKSSLNEKKDNTHCIVAMLSPLVGTPLGAQTLLGTVTFPAVTGPASTAMPPAMLLAWPSSKTPLLAPSPIPPAIGNLRYLQVVRLHKLPNLYSTIPPEIAKLSNLRFLTISWTGVYGSVPSFLANLTALEQLDLSFNKLSGFIPSSLGDLPKLYSIDISRNNLTGTIPASLLHKVSDSYLLLSHNNLTGPVPKSFQKVDFRRVDLSRNKLIGDASVFFGQSKSTQSIDLSRNKLMFDLSKVKFPEAELLSLDLNHNMIYGSIPKQITKVVNLQGFNVSYNMLCGEIPQGGKLGKLDKYSFFHNKCLCGPPLEPCT
ncbi:hypothetical protein J5N97_026218 [Dioscorea zingiberensis]|uniref:Uncharacterized protein n=1 Tax=Dioscorea zingiberensis TaxID=325984 RepID=A0A9D5C2G3_9LILI|nr:hypothetical protein J5N97_026218 [Dioscorea zingiberensis]